LVDILEKCSLTELGQIWEYAFGFVAELPAPKSAKRNESSSEIFGFVKTFEKKKASSG
jgi:hypothetical protein